MAITPAALQTALGVTIGDPLVMRADETGGRVTRPSRNGWCMVEGRCLVGCGTW